MTKDRPHCWDDIGPNDAQLLFEDVVWFRHLFDESERRALDLIIGHLGIVMGKEPGTSTTESR